MAFSEEEGLEWEICLDGRGLEHLPQFKYLGCVLNEFGSDERVS